MFQPQILPRSQGVLLPATPPVLDVVRHFPHKTVDLAGRPGVMLRHGLDLSRALDNAGVEAPSHFDSFYDWSNVSQPPFRTQKVTASLCVHNYRAFVLNDLGTGKTRAVLFAIDYLFSIGRIDLALIIAPLSTLGIVWETEIMFNFPRLRGAVLHGSKEKREKLLKRARRDWNVAIINHDGVATVLDSLKKAGFKAAVIDEVAVFRHQQRRRWKAVNAVVERIPYVWGMTGAPTPNSYADAYAQAKLVNPSNLRGKTYTQFREDVLTRVGEFRYLPRAGAHKIVADALQPAVRFVRSDVVELPPCTTVERDVVLEPVQERAYRTLKAQLHAKFVGGDVTAVNAAVLMGKLLQVAGGAVYTDVRGVVRLPCASRLAVVEEVIEQSSSKVIVFVPYRHIIDVVAEHLTKAGRTVGLVHGGVPLTRRTAIFQAFQNGDEPDTIVAHPAAMAHGVTLVAADTVAWYLPTLSQEVYEQANARITRPGQRHKQWVAHLVGSEVERRIYRLLRTKAINQASVLELFEQMTKP